MPISFDGNEVEDDSTYFRFGELHCQFVAHGGFLVGEDLFPFASDSVDNDEVGAMFILEIREEDGDVGSYFSPHVVNILWKGVDGGFVLIRSHRGHVFDLHDVSFSVAYYNRLVGSVK